MTKKQQKLFFSKYKFQILSALVGLLLLLTAFIVCTVNERNQGSQTIDETLTFMQNLCLRYDNLTAAEETKEQIQLLDKTKELRRCLTCKVHTSDKKSFAKKYLENQRLSGIVLTDQNLKAEVYVSSADSDYENWKQIISDENVSDTVKYGKKTYVARIEQSDGTIYDYAATGRDDGKGLILCYAEHIQTEADDYQIGIDNLLEGYRLEMNGLILITDEDHILSSNEDDLLGKAITDYPLLADHRDEISSDQISRLSQDGTSYLARSGKCRDYYLYVYFPTSEIFQERFIVMVALIVLYIFFLFVYAILRQREMKVSSQLKLKFLRQMSHDIRTPINGIQGMVRIGNRFPQDMQKQQECREKIWEASGYLMDIVNDVLVMGKLESDEIELEEKSFNLHDLVKSVCSDMSIAAENCGVVLTLRGIRGTHQNLIGSSTYVRRILTNIISNAIKYNEEHGTVTISCVEEVQTTPSKKTSYQFVCADTGIGMSREFQKRMFTQFAQENRKGDLKQHGTGLGLAIVKNLVQKMDGTIECESEPGEGTIFTITLPFLIDDTPELPEALPPEEETAEDELHGVSILLVEDNELNMEIAEFILVESGATVTKAWNGEEAVNLFANSKYGEFQVILMDMMMPVMNGEEATRAIRALDREDASRIPILAMTANAFEEDVQAALEAGMNEHLAKPIDAVLLKRTIRKYLAP